MTRLRPESTWALLIGLSLVHLTSSCTRSEPIEIATTRSITDARLLESLQRESGHSLRVHASDSVRAVEMLRDEVVDVVITRERINESLDRRAYPAWVYRKFAHNKTILAGPRNDPADVRGATDVADALRRLAASSESFVSHAGDGEVNAIERYLSRSGLMPTRVLRTDQGVGSALSLASERQAYLLVNEATFRTFEKQLNLALLFERDDLLTNTYTVIYPPWNSRASRFGEWLTRGDGLRLIAGHRVDGHVVFRAWLRGCPDSDLEDRPCRLSSQGKPIKDYAWVIDGTGPPPTLREMLADADAAVVGRYTGQSREFSAPRRPDSPRTQRLGQFEIVEVMKPHPAVPGAGARVEVAVPGSYQEFPAYILHSYAEGHEEPEAGRIYVLFIRERGASTEVRLNAAWSQGGIYDVSGDFVKALSPDIGRFRDWTPTKFLAEMRRR